MILSICSNPSTLKVFKLVRIVIMIIKIAVPIALIVSVMIDYMKVVSDPSDSLEKTNKLMVKKVIAAVLIFTIPTLVNIISNTIGFNPNNFISCLENSTNENIELMQERFINKLIDENKDNFNDSTYTIIYSEITKLKSESKKEEYISKITALKEEATQKRKEDEAKQKGGSNNERINAYTQKAVEIANDDSHGYCNLRDCSQGNMFNPDVDCGTLVRFSLSETGIIPPDQSVNPNYHDTANSELSKYGFVMHPFNKEELQYGDILHCDGHMAIWLGNNQIVAAHNNRGHPEPHDQGNEVSVMNFYLCGSNSNEPWLYYFRLEN